MVGQLFGSTGTRARHKLQHVWGHTGLPEALTKLPGHQQRIGRGLEYHCIAGRQGGHDTAAGDSNGKIPGRDDHAHALAATTDVIHFEKCICGMGIVFSKINCL